MSTEVSTALAQLTPRTRHALTHQLAVARDGYAASGDQALAAVFAAFMSLAHESTVIASRDWAEVRASFDLPAKPPVR